MDPEVIVNDDNSIAEVVVVNNGDGTGTKTITCEGHVQVINLTNLPLVVAEEPYLNSQLYIDILTEAEIARQSAYDTVINSRLFSV